MGGKFCAEFFSSLFLRLNIGLPPSSLPAQPRFLSPPPSGSALTKVPSTSLSNLTDSSQPRLNLISGNIGQGQWAPLFKALSLLVFGEVMLSGFLVLSVSSEGSFPLKS